MKMADAELELPNQVIVEILSWLPVKSLVQFSSVCKFWKSLLSNPHFIKLHLQRSSKKGNLITTFTTSGATKRYVTSCSIASFLQKPYIASQGGHLLLNSKYKVLGSCNGLVCLIGSTRGYRIGQNWVRFWNPATRLKSRKSPVLHVKLCASEIDSTKFGFGYDKYSDTYKVVAMVCRRNFDMEDSERTQVKVFTMGDHCWRDIKTFPSFPIIFRTVGRFMNGTLNWLAIRNYTSPCDWNTGAIDQLVIVSLDLGNETFKLLSLPELDEIPWVAPAIGVFGDCLCLFHDYKWTNFVVWQMKEFGVESSWTQLVSVSYQRLQVGMRVNFSSLLPLCISENGDALLMLNNNFELIIYYRGDNRVGQAKYHDSVWIDTKDHVHSLVVPY